MMLAQIDINTILKDHGMKGVLIVLGVGALSESSDDAERR